MFKFDSIHFRLVQLFAHVFKLLLRKTTITFINEAKPVALNKLHRNAYGFDAAPRLLFVWSRLFQTVVSQAGTYLLTQKYHNQQCSIYKCEGGCKIAGVNDLVLTKNGCYFDYGDFKINSQNEKKLSDLITSIVLAWDPNNPIDSMLNAAATYIGRPFDEFKEIIDKSDSGGGIFGGDALTSFFDHNPFMKWEQNRDYLRFCYKNFDNKSDEIIDQIFADDDLSERLLKDIKSSIEMSVSKGFYSKFSVHVMCCSPSRKTDELKFWINGSGIEVKWYTEREVQELIEKISRGEKLIQTK